MKRYVVDASVIIKWAAGDERESDQEKARFLLQEWSQGLSEIFVPGLWKFETGNFLGRELPEEAVSKMNLLLALGLREIDLSAELCRQCFAWMKEKKTTFYDVSYLAVALQIDGVLITADESFVRKMGPMERLRLLKNIDIT